MSANMRRELYTLYVILIMYNIVTINCAVSNDDEPDTLMTDDEYRLVSMRFLLAEADGSGGTSTDSTTLSTQTLGRFNCSQSEILWSNNVCISKTAAQTIYVNRLRNNSISSSMKANALIDFFEITTNLSTTPNQRDNLTPRETEQLIDELNDITILDSNTGLFIALPTINESDIVLGGSVTHPTNNVIVRNTNKPNVIRSNITAAAIIDDRSANETTIIRVFILSRPTAYENLDLSNEQSVVSPIISASVDKKHKQAVIDIQLHFQVVKDHQAHIHGRYSCSFLDINTFKWNASGCTTPFYNAQFDRYECTCNHLTTFALLWLPKTSQSDYLTSQDIASLVFLSLSIFGFITVILHTLIIRFRNPLMSLVARDLMPLISSASTAILFVFYIALTMTVYTQISSSSVDTTSCFLSASILMFITYFLLIFMLCVKTSVGYFNYLRFVHLFPEPSYRKLGVMIIISFLISTTYTTFAIGFNSNSSYNITGIYQNKLCWFTSDVIYYFLTIPVCIFLLLNLIIFILVTRRIIIHARNGTSPHQSYERMKRCVLVLLSSCVTQGIGWLFGPFITFVNPTAGNVLEWFFIIFNGLEGVWSILLYMIIRSQQTDVPKRVTDRRKRLKKTSSRSVRQEESRKRISVSKRRLRATNRNT